VSTNGRSRPFDAAQARPVVLKFGGELLENPASLSTVASSVAAIRLDEPNLLLVHGAGREIDAALERAGIEKRQVEGLRVTDEATLEIVVSVLAGAVNTRIVAALNVAGVPAVGLTGADAGCGLSKVAPPHRTADGQAVNLGRVGVPVDEADPALLWMLIESGFVPVLASIGVDSDGQLLNVNADTLAGRLAARLNARRLIVAGTTPGVMGKDGQRLESVAPQDLTRLIADGTATAGMIAKLRACEHALARGVDDVIIVDGRDRSALVHAGKGMSTAGTRISTQAEDAV
jgi:acetylglutamate kinase